VQNIKKLLSLLSVLTISGSAIPTITANSSYEKEKYKTDSSSQPNDSTK
jgi:hypothetical protein